MSVAEPLPLTAWRCVGCGNLLARVVVAAGTVVQIKCRSCNTMNEVRR